jgi:lipoprotein-anchoring transpeptidase ErfK/SrfK
MEVLMQRERRISRPLFAALVILIILALGFYLHRMSEMRAAELQRIADARVLVPTPAAEFTIPPQTQPAVDEKADAAPVITQTPLAASADVRSNDQPPKLAATAVVVDDEPTTRPATLLATDLTTHHDLVAQMPVAGPTTAPAAPIDTLASATQKQQTGDNVAARDMLNASLLSGTLSEQQADSVRHQMAAINQALVFSNERSATDPWSASYTVQSGERLSSIANRNNVTWQLLSRINHVDPRRLRAGATIKTLKGPFYAVVTKSRFRMDIYLGAPGGPGSMYVTSFMVGLGKDDSTPTGTWQVQSGNKILHPRYYSPRGEAPIDADDPKNPLGGYWIGLEGIDGAAVDKHSYGVHGTIEPDSIGKQASLGCIRLGHDDISLTFDMMVEGKSKIVVNP